MTGSKPMRADARRNRDALIAAARAAFDRGATGLRFDDFAALAGVGTGTLYRHFPTRAALVDAVYQEEVAALSAHAHRLLAEGTGADALARFLHDFVAHLVAHEDLARALGTLMDGRDETQADGGRVLAQTVDELIAAGRRDGTLAGPISAGAVMTALHGIGATCGQPGWRDDARSLIDLLVRA